MADRRAVITIRSSQERERNPLVIVEENASNTMSQADSIGAFMFELHETENPITTFDNKLWISVIESITVKNNGTLLFRFRNGMGIEG